jgi:hypothetical protein
VATYGDLKTRIKNEIGRTTDPDMDTAVVNAVADAITYYTQTPFWFLETSQDIANVAGAAGYSLPTDFRTLVSVSQGGLTAGSDLLTIPGTETKCRHCQDIEKRRRDAAKDQREQHA